MKFFIDNNLSVQLAEGMQGFGEKVEHLRETFPEDTADTVWLRHIGEKRIILITRDNRIRRRPAELMALHEYKVGAFFLAGKNKTRCELIKQLVRNWPRIKEYALKTKCPFAFRVPPTGAKIKQIPLR